MAGWQRSNLRSCTASIFDRGFTSFTPTSTHDLGNLTVNRISFSTPFAGLTNIILNAASGADVLTFDGTTPQIDVALSGFGFGPYLRIPVVLNQTLTITGNTGAEYVLFDGGVSGTGGLRLSNSAKALFGQSNGANYSGTTLLDSGTQMFSSSFTANALSPNSAHVINGELYIVGSAEIGSLAGSGIVGLISNLTVGGLNTSTNFSGTLSFYGGLVKTGTGTLTLTGENTHTGDTTIVAGTLQIGNGGTSDSFTEKDGGVTNLQVNEDNQDSLRSSLGARITHRWDTNGYRITPTAELAWVHEFMEDEAGIRAGFATAPNTTSV